MQHMTLDRNDMWYNISQYNSLYVYNMSAHHVPSVRYTIYDIPSTTPTIHYTMYNIC